jgi:pyruvate formate lyase activating enzyme
VTSTGVIFDIQRFSLHDGPGIRTVVFMKGCPLVCRWCSNPESQTPYPELLHSAGRCTGCGRCGGSCPAEAITIEDGVWTIDRARCDACGACAPVCLEQALRVAGRVYTVEEVVDAVRRDAPFYRRSGGGVTFSGGEPLMQSHFVARVMRRCRQMGYHTAVETSGCASASAVETVAEHCRLFLFDVKQVDDTRHRAGTGVSTSSILDNLRLVRSLGCDVIVRVPVISGFNDDDQSLLGLAELLRDTGVGEVHLLPYHTLGGAKYRALDRVDPMAGTQALGGAHLQTIVGVLEHLVPEVEVRVVAGTSNGSRERTQTELTADRGRR